ncbi:hypothetical protein AUJ83_00595 [Candidatus Woesearchaeota archaeon CG1_02_33_12]|nr:MAG: hypothetical protein AUJ83_00595 [Candidatus Woesearchaeota archaeon CG1_02_33_12]
MRGAPDMKIEINFQPSCSENIISLAIDKNKLKKFKNKLKKILEKNYNKKTVNGCLLDFDSNDLDNDCEINDNCHRVCAGESSGDYYQALKQIAVEMDLQFDIERG